MLMPSDEQMEAEQLQQNLTLRAILVRQIQATDVRLQNRADDPDCAFEETSLLAELTGFYIALGQSFAVVVE